MATMRTSIHGRRFGLSTTGGILSGYDATGGHSTAFESQAQMWGKTHHETVTADAGVISNQGVTFITTASTNGSTYFLSAPVLGVYKEIHIVSSATAMNLETTAATIFIGTTAATGVDVGTTHLDLDSTAAGVGVAGSIILRGLSTTFWSVISHSVEMSS